MKRKILLSILCGLIAIVRTWAQDVTLSVDPVIVQPGSSATLAINITGATQFIAAGMYVQLPDSMTFVYNNEEEAYVLGGDVLAKSQSVADKLQSSSLIKFAITSLQNKEFAKDEGTLATFKVSCGSGVEMGTYMGTLKTIELSKADKTGLYAMDDVPFTISVGDPSNIKYTATFIADGKTVSTQSLAVGDSIKVPIAPDKRGYTFVSWGDVAPTMPSQNVTYTAEYTVNYYRLRFVADGKVVSEDSLAYGTPITQPAPVEKEGYTFTSWGNVTTVMPAQDLTYTARYTINKYLLTFRLDDGTVLSSDSVEYDSPITTPSAPERDGYIFNGWGNVPAKMPAQDMTFTGSYHDNAVLAVDSPNGNLRAILQQNPEVTRLTITGQMQGDDFNALLELPEMEELTLPAVNSQNNTIQLGQLSKLLVLTTTESATTLNDNAFEGCNPNLMVYAPAGATIGGTHCNVIIDGIAENIRLTDGRSMRVSQSFTAKTVSYTRSFTKQTYMNESAGWESITLPFDVQNIQTADGRTIVPFGSTTTGDCNFWLATVGTNGFESATQMQANVPYIIAMPNSSEYKEELNITGDVTFMGQNVTIERTDNVTAQSGLYVFTPFYEANGQTDVYAINDNTYGNYHPGGAFVRGLRAARPFEGYITMTSGAKQRDFIPIMGVDATSIAGIAADEDASATYYTLDGRMIRKPTTSGTYLIRKGTSVRKVMVK